MKLRPKLRQKLESQAVQDAKNRVLGSRWFPLLIGYGIVYVSVRSTKLKPTTLVINVYTTTPVHEHRTNYN